MFKNIWNRILVVSIKLNNKKLMARAILNGADINQLDKNELAPVEYACIYERYDMLKILVNMGCCINWKDHNSLSMYLAARNEYKLLWALIEKGMNPNTRMYLGTTALRWAIQEDSFESVKILLKEGAQVNILDDMEESPLYNAAGDGNNKIVRLLLKYHADVNFDKRVSALMIACCFGHYETAKILLENGADVNFLDNMGRNSLFHVKVREEDDVEEFMKIERLLYAYQADDTIRDYRGICAKDLNDPVVRKMVWKEIFEEDI